MTAVQIDRPSTTGTSNFGVLVFSTSADTRAALLDVLTAAGEFALDSFDSEQAAAVALTEGLHEVALIDLDCGDGPGLSALETLAAAAPDTALIALTASTDERLAVGALQLGAQECLLRGTDDLRPERLRRTLRNAVLRRGPATGGQQLERAFDEAPIGMVILDDDMRLLRVNRSVARMLGRTRAELVGSTLDEFMLADQEADDGVPTVAPHADADGQHVSERCLLHADGHRIWVELAVSPIGAAHGDGARMVAQIQDMTERRAQVESLQHIADHDPLTGLLNRRGFDRELGGHLTRAIRYGATGALLIFDLDNFKIHNDTFGHDAGDALLRRLGEALRTRLRSSDVVGRLGGDEFAVLLPDADRSRAVQATLSLLDEIRESTSSMSSASVAGITASIGLVCFEVTGPLDVDTAKRYADAAMYLAKRRGRDQYAEWTPSTPQNLALATAASSGSGRLRTRRALARSGSKGRSAGQEVQRVASQPPIWSAVQSDGALSSRQRWSFVPWRMRPPLDWS
jgi:diguanylate cyclase (GGDEF)-like protein/PAS domain S-box-containing protein